MKAGRTIVVIEDDTDIFGTIKRGWPDPADTLVHRRCLSSSRALQGPKHDCVDAFIIDVRLPDGDGLSFAREMRAVTDAPIIMISGTGDSDFRAEAMYLGCDDYVMKPFSVRELHSRVVRAFRNGKPENGNADNDISHVGSRGEFEIGSVVVSSARRELLLDNHSVALTDAEFRIIEVLANRINQRCSREHIYIKALFRSAEKDDKTLDVYIGRIRNKIRTLDEESACYIHTVRGFGYMLSSSCTGPR